MIKKKKYKSLDDDDFAISEDIVVGGNFEEIVVDADNTIEDKDCVAPDEDGADAFALNDEVSIETVSGETILKIEPIRKNQPPKKTWSDFKKLKYKTGDLVVLKDNSTSIKKVMGPGIKTNTYELKTSGTMTTFFIDAKLITFAPEGSIWISFYEMNDPVKRCQIENEARQKRKQSEVDTRSKKSTKRKYTKRK
jgi:hypothetical protein